MKKILLITAILAAFIGYIDNAKASDRLAAMRVSRAATFESESNSSEAACNYPCIKHIPAPQKSISQIREEDFRSMQTLMRNLKLKTKEQEDETQKIKQENTRFSEEIGKLNEELNWTKSTIDYIVRH